MALCYSCQLCVSRGGGELRAPCVSVMDQNFLFSVLSHIHVRVELLSHLVILCWPFGGTVRLFSTEFTPFYLLPSYVQGFQFLHLLADACHFPLNFFLIITLLGMKWYLVILTCICLMTNDVKHLYLVLTGHLCIFREMSKFVAHF